MVKPKLLINVQHSKKPVHITGAGGVQFLVHNIEYLPDFFPHTPVIVFTTTF